VARALIGLAVGSGLEGVDAAAIRADGIGLDLTPAVLAAVRVAFPPSLRDIIRAATPGSGFPVGNEFVRNVAETTIHAARQVMTRSGVSPRDAFAAGLLEPARPVAEPTLAWPEIADRVAEQTGLTVIHGFRHRDRAAGGAGHPITAAADYLLFRSPTRPRLLLHLGAVAGMLLVPAGAKISAAGGFEAGPGNQLLDALIYHGTRGKEPLDPGGKKAVQGHCIEQLLERWSEHPHLTRTPPKVVHSEAFSRSFLLTAFESARQLGVGLPDLLCTATHLVARSIGEAARRWLPGQSGVRQILVSGGGTRNGFLWQLITQQFPGEMVERCQEAGVSPLARNAAAAALLAALTCDGVAGSHSALTGANGGRLLGHIAPGDGRNWARLTAWLADQTGEYPRINRVA
jgi:anhydro-N-acetylmuramic acid kinase